ncbi:MAG: hypothetical protein ACLFPL_04920 [Candidatus Nanoarchaeia archaeon]
MKQYKRGISTTYLLQVYPVSRRTIYNWIYHTNNDTLLDEQQRGRKPTSPNPLIYTIVSRKWPELR